MLEKSYETYKEWIPKTPYVNWAGMETAINLTLGDDEVKRVKVEVVLDESFVKELDQAGDYRQLYRSY